jgi:Alr-MurF fusion protein
MTIYSLSKIADITGGRQEGSTDLTIHQLLIDSRSATATSSSLFFAIQGRQHDGHRYITELYQRGVRAFVVSVMPEQFTTFTGAGFIVVSDTLTALQQLARYHREQFSCPVVAISGSNGKTIVKEWLYHCLSDNFTITRSPKSYNSQVGVPLSIWLMDENTTMGIFEAGISLPGEMMKLQQMIQPDIGIFTNIGEAHQESFENIDQKITEKLRLFYNCHTLIYCHDHQPIRDAIEKTPELAGVRLFSWSATTKADVQVAGISIHEGKTSLKISHKDLRVEITIPFTDDASVENAMHCLVMMLLLKTDSRTIVSKMSGLFPVAMRLEQKSAIHDCTLINDSYNADINSLSIALDVLNRQLQHERKTLILSDILQSGKRQHELYRMVAALVKGKGITRIIGIGENITKNASLFTTPGDFYETTQAFIHDFNPAAFRNEAILLKGSRQFEFEKIAALLEQKKHTTRIEINVNALVHNLNYFRSLLHADTKIMVMVKALSYGSGRHEIAGILQFQGVDYLGVAIADEGVSLRQAGITLPIMVMNPEAESFDSIIEHRLEPEIYGFGMLDLFQKAVNRNQEIDYPVHIKLDTGMNRMGFMASETETLCQELTRLKNIRVCSVFSHLAGSDEEEFDDFTRSQIALFKQASDDIIRTLGYPVIRHILNTSGIERFPEAQFNMVRLGIGLYGISSVDQRNLRNVSTLKSTILQIKPVEPGATVGYGRKGKPEKSSLIAVIPVGYADGLNRRLSNGKGVFLVNGKRAPIVGNICMDMTMIDVTETGAKEGDEVVIFGEGNPITTLARQLNTIPYEILTGVSERVKRVYFQE